MHTRYKQKLPKGWSYPLQNSDFLSLLSEEVLSDVSFSYSRAHRSINLASYLVFLGTKRPDRGIAAAAVSEWDFKRLSVKVYNVPSGYRKALRDGLNKHVLSRLNHWLEEACRRKDDHSYSHFEVRFVKPDKLICQGMEMSWAQGYTINGQKEESTSI